MSKWMRHRFLANTDDYRPVRFPPPGPYWCTGYRCEDDGDNPVIVAYLPLDVSVTDWWPEATDIDSEGPRNEITFTDRFQKPDWWQP